jgi:hypothetical protein
MYGSPDINQPGVGIVAHEIEKSTRLNEADDLDE